MKRILKSGVILLAALFLVSCTKNNTDTQKPKEVKSSTIKAKKDNASPKKDKDYPVLIEFAQTVQKWLNYPKNVGATSVIDAKGEKLIVTIDAELSNTSEDGLLQVAKKVQEIRDNVHETYTTTNENLKPPLLVIKDKTNKAYVTESEDGTLTVDK
ncbi:hypothetical protein [Streptococcus phocae]|uniref:Uncharacterized protein n=1 Tax=Streptococcus phocae TaxID=119224 RepID=A0A0P6SNR1_9STRE|nr:hypothetical protein [Streptococcus phocae]KPJ23072.1 hypothetical protein AKK44_01450 [Streptococcus phocae]